MNNPQCPCGSTDLEWFSGVPGVHISLNGQYSGACRVCGEPFWADDEEEV